MKDKSNQAYILLIGLTVGILITAWAFKSMNDKPYNSMYENCYQGGTTGKELICN